MVFRIGSPGENSGCKLHRWNAAGRAAVESHLHNRGWVATRTTRRFHSRCSRSDRSGIEQRDFAWAQHSSLDPMCVRDLRRVKAPPSILSIPTRFIASGQQLSFRRPLRTNLLITIGLILCLAITVSQTYPLASAQSRMFYGFVYSASNGKPIAATVTLSRCFNQQTASTNADGSWELPYPYGALGTITFSAPGFATQSFQIEMNAQWYDSGGIVSLQPSA
jgi:hypothetical protein